MVELTFALSLDIDSGSRSIGEAWVELCGGSGDAKAEGDLGFAGTSFAGNFDDLA